MISSIIKSLLQVSSLQCQKLLDELEQLTVDDWKKELEPIIALFLWDRYSCMSMLSLLMTCQFSFEKKKKEHKTLISVVKLKIKMMVDSRRKWDKKPFN